MKYNDKTELSNEIISKERTPEEQLILKEKMHKLHMLINELMPGDKLIVYRKYYYLQSTEQIAAEMGLTVRAVEGRLYRIRKKLRGKWDE